MDKLRPYTANYFEAGLTLVYFFSVTVVGLTITVKQLPAKQVL